MNLFKIPITLTYQDVLPFLGMNKEPSTQEKELIERYIKEIKLLAEPIGIWKTLIVKKWTPEQISLDASPLLLEGPSISVHFKTCVQITLIATTLGSKVDQLLFDLSPQSPAQALIADAVASAAIEFFTDQLDHYLSGLISHKGYFPTARFSPGYGDWSLNWQKEFLTSIEGDKIGLTTTAYFLLEPTKSVTAAIGWSSIPVERSYNLPIDEINNSTDKPYKPCRSIHTCSNCKLVTSCPDRLT